MGKGNTSKGRNAFYYFMLEFKSRQGRNYKSMAEAAAAADPHWQVIYSKRQMMNKYISQFLLIHV